MPSIKTMSSEIAKITKQKITKGLKESDDCGNFIKIKRRVHMQKNYKRIYKERTKFKTKYEESGNLPPRG